MQSARHIFISFLLIIGVVISTVPFNAFHNHSEILCVEHTEDVDPCHLQIYHGYINVEETCDHNTHVHAEFEKCEWCKFVSPARENFSSSTNTSLFYSSLVSNLYSIIQKNECSTYFANQSNRGPPLA